MKRCLIVALLVALGGVASEAVQQGDTELDFLGGWFSANGADGVPDSDVLFLSAGLGYFLTDNIQVGVGAMGAWAEVADTDVDVYAIGAKAKYHFMPTNQWVPYIGIQIAFADADTDGGDGDGTLWGPMAGLRYELNAMNDFYVEVQYHVWEGDVGDVLDDSLGIFLGIIHQFK